jgi:hypothetical protein
MTEKLLDALGALFWWGIFLTPLLVFPLVWRNSTFGWPAKLFLAIGTSAVLVAFFFLISIALVFRNGMGPG